MPQTIQKAVLNFILRFRVGKIPCRSTGLVAMLDEKMEHGFDSLCNYQDNLLHQPSLYWY